MTAVLSVPQDHHFNYNLHMYSSQSSPSSPSGHAADWKAKYYAVEDMLTETRNELDEFQQSSKELEEELERELERTEKAQEELKLRVEKVEGERDEWKSKYVSLQQNHNTTVNSLQRELEAIRQRESLYKTQLRELELGNDDLERNERQASSSLADVEAKYARALEEKILLEHELQDKVSLEETCQRLRDELRDVNTEVAVLKEQRHRVVSAPVAQVHNLSTSSLHRLSLNGAVESESLLRSMPPDLLIADLLPSSTPPSSRSSLYSRRSQDLTNSISTSPTSISSSRSSTIRNTPTQTDVFTRALSPISAPGGSRLPVRNMASPMPATPRTPRIPVRVASAIPKSKGVQMVTEMRARVRTLEMKIHSNMPRIRVASSAAGTSNSFTRLPSPRKVTGVMDSPGWVMVEEEVPASPTRPRVLKATPIPALDFSNTGPSSRPAFGLRPVRTLHQSQTNPRSRSPPPPCLASSTSATIQSTETPRPPSRIATFAASTANSLVSPLPQVPSRSTTPTQSARLVSMHKPTTNKPPTSGTNNKWRGTVGAGANVIHAGTTPGRARRRNITSPATPPPVPSLPSFDKALNNDMAPTHGNNIHGGMNVRSGIFRVASSRMGQPSSVGVPNGKQDIRRERSGTFH